MSEMKYLQLAQLKTEGEPCYVDPMAISLEQIKHELYPGLAAIQASERYASAFYDWRSVFGTTFERSVAAPHVWIPAPPLPIAVAAAAAAVIVKNPVVTRRFWQGWLTKDAK